MTAPTFDRPAVDWERHAGHGGPKILPPPGVEWTGRTGKPQAHRYYSRATSMAKLIEGNEGLVKWKLRRLLVGIGQRPDYQAAAAALTMDERDKAAGNELAELAMEAAGPSAALIGTALHTWTERVDRGEPLGHIPPEYRPLVDTYAELTQPLTFAHRECRTVCDALETAGTPDGLGTCAIPDPDGVVDGLRVIDTKSGKVDYPASMSVQLAIYSRSDLYDPATGTRTPVEVNRRWGIIVHLQQDGAVPPGLYWLNLEHGHRGIDVAQQVKAWRAVRPGAILQPFAEQLPELEQPATGPDEPSWTTGALEAIAAAAHTSDLTGLWARHGADWGEWPTLVEALRQRHAELAQGERLRAPRAALLGALSVAGRHQLDALWAQHGGTDVWTEEATAAAVARWAEVRELEGAA